MAVTSQPLTAAAFAFTLGLTAVACGGSSGDDATSDDSALSAPAAGGSTATASWVGLYEAETTHRAWAIRVRSTKSSPVTFELFAGHLEDSSEHVDAGDLVAQLDPAASGTAPSATFTKGGCTIKLSLTIAGGTTAAETNGGSPSGLLVQQSGTCTEIGMPDTDDLAMDQLFFGRLAEEGTGEEKAECFDTKKLAVSTQCDSPL